MCSKLHGCSLSFSLNWMDVQSSCKSCSIYVRVVLIWLCHLLLLFIWYSLLLHEYVNMYVRVLCMVELSKEREGKGFCCLAEHRQETKRKPVLLTSPAQQYSFYSFFIITTSYLPFLPPTNIVLSRFSLLYLCISLRPFHISLASVGRDWFWKRTAAQKNRTLKILFTIKMFSPASSSSHLLRSTFFPISIVISIYF